LHAVSLTDKKCAYIVPGLATVGVHDVRDIIRGEETQIVGALDDSASDEFFGLETTWVDGAVRLSAGI
jgi:2-keto-3-deoxy-galactonokinase